MEPDLQSAIEEYTVRKGTPENAARMVRAAFAARGWEEEYLLSEEKDNRGNTIRHMGKRLKSPKYGSPLDFLLANGVPVKLHLSRLSDAQRKSLAPRAGVIDVKQ